MENSGAEVGSGNDRQAAGGRAVAPIPVSAVVSRQRLRGVSHTIGCTKSVLYTVKYREATAHEPRILNSRMNAHFKNNVTRTQVTAHWRQRKQSCVAVHEYA